MVQTVDEYIALQPEPFRRTLEEMRKIIYSVAPEATEAISYQVPCFKYLYHLVGIGVTKDHCSLYIMSTALALSLKGSKFMGTKTTLHFLPGEALPVALIKKIVRARMKENELRAGK